MNVAVRLRNCPDAARGYLRRFLNEIDPNFYVGNLSSRVIDSIWEKLNSISDKEDSPNLAIQIIKFTSENEQKFILIERSRRKNSVVIESDGLLLIGKLTVNEE